MRLLNRVRDKSLSISIKRIGSPNGANFFGIYLDSVRRKVFTGFALRAIKLDFSTGKQVTSFVANNFRGVTNLKWLFACVLISFSIFHVPMPSISAL